MKKRIIAILLVVAMLVTFVACGEAEINYYKFGDNYVNALGTTVTSNNVVKSAGSGYDFQFSLLKGSNSISRTFVDDALAQVYLVSSTSKVDSYTPVIWTGTQKDILAKEQQLTKVLDLGILENAIKAAKDIATELAKYGITSQLITNIITSLTNVSKTLSGVDFVLYADKVENGLPTVESKFFLVAGLPVLNQECVFVVPDLAAALEAAPNLFEFIKNFDFNK